MFPVIAAVSFSHLLNDMMQSLLLAIYPLFKQNLSLSFAQLGLITLCYQITASLLQPLVGLYSDWRPKPFSLAMGMGFTLVGLLLISQAHEFHLLLGAAALVGTGSAIFHPESARVARMAAGPRVGLAQSLFQVGGNLGSSLGPLCAAWLVMPHGQGSLGWFSICALLAMVVLFQVGRWYAARLASRKANGAALRHGLSSLRVSLSLFILGVLMFSKFFYMASIGSYYTFYLIDGFALSVQQAQVCLFVFMFSVAVGTLSGGQISDRVGHLRMIRFSIIGVAPFTLALPYAGFAGTVALSVVIGLILSSAFPAIVVYAQDLLPGKVGLVSGLFFGLAFGLGGVGAALLGRLADATSIGFVYHVCSFLPLLGFCALGLPDLKRLPAA